MAKLSLRPTLTMTIVLELTEEEAMALDALAGYGTDAFLKVFYQLGRTYLEPHEKGLRSLFATVRDVVPGYRSQAEEARKVFSGRAA